MKRSIAIILSSSILLSLASCYKTEENIWEDSSAERLDKKLADYENILCAEENGWVLQYFANESEQAYPLLMKFDKTSAVKMAANNSVSSSAGYAEAESTYELISDMGPVLTFNTYNPLLHCFSDPGSNGLGHLGDYEFVFYSANEDGSLTLKGKKHGIKMNMIKFPMGASYSVSGQEKTIASWENYYEAYNAVKSELFPSKAKIMFLSVGDESYKLSGMKNGVLSIVNNNTKGGEIVSRSYVIGLDKSIHFSSAFAGSKGGFAVSNFKLSDDGILECTDSDQNAFIYSGTVSSCFLAAENIWRFNRNLLSDAVSKEYKQMGTDCQKAGYGNLQYVQFAWNTDNDMLSLDFKTTKYRGTFLFDSELVSDNVVVLKFNEEKTRTNGTDDTNNAMEFYDSFESFRNLLSILSAKFTMEGNSKLAITTITMQDESGNSIVVDVN